MSCLIWLTLNGDLRNNGLNGTNFTNNASSGYAIASIDNGKTGKCYSFDGHNWLSSSSTVGANMTNWTIACWICPTNLDSTWRRIGGIGKHTRTHLDISSGNYPRFFCSKDGTSSNFVACNATGNILETNTWYHLCGVVSNEYIGLYINGERISSTSRPDDLAYFSADTVYIGSIESGNKFIGKICDFRIYDTALSDYEIKLLSQGLVLHYPLDRNGLGGENLITNSLPNSSGTLWSVAGTNWARAFVANDFSPSGYICRATYNGSTTTQTGGAHRGPVIAKADFEDGAEYTLSGWLRADATCTVRFCNELMTSVSNITVTPEWQYFTVTSTVDTSKTYSSDVMYRYGNIYNGCWQEACMIKLEKGSKATPWSPADSELGSDLTTVYDTSGFGNNGTATNVTYDGDTARYTASSVMDGSTSIITTGAKQTITDAVTFCMWAYMDNWTQCTGSIGNCIQGGGWGFQHATDKTQLQVGTGTSSVTWTVHVKKYSELSSGWHHFAVTYDGFTLVSYIDGAVNNTTEIYTTKTPIFYSTTAGANSLFIGGESGDSLTTPANKFTGKVSDARVYCTALSAEDIKDLFDASAKINRDGTMYAYSYVEN